MPNRRALLLNIYYLSPTFRLKSLMTECIYHDLKFESNSCDTKTPYHGFRLMSFQLKVFAARAVSLKWIEISISFLFAHQTKYLKTNMKTSLKTGMKTTKIDLVVRLSKDRSLCTCVFMVGFRLEFDGNLKSQSVGVCLA